MRIDLCVLGLGLGLLGFACGGDDDGDGNGNPDGGGSDGVAVERVRGFLRADTYTKLVLEVDIVPGQEPSPEAEADLVELLGQRLDKPGGVEAVHDGALVSVGTDHAWTFDELMAVADESYDLAVDADTIKMHVMIVDGHSAEDVGNSAILGVAWDHTHLVLYKETIEANCRDLLGGPLADELCIKTELGIWTHETGHLLGLVDNGLPMVTGHRDPDEAHGAHDASTDCIMYWSYQRGGLVGLIEERLMNGQTEDLGFDAECLADLAAIRDE